MGAYHHKIRYNGQTVEASGAAARIKAAIDEIQGKSLIEVDSDPLTAMHFVNAGSNTLRLVSDIVDDGKLFQIGSISNNGAEGSVGVREDGKGHFLLDFVFPRVPATGGGLSYPPYPPGGEDSSSSSSESDSSSSSSASHKKRWKVVAFRRTTSARHPNSNCGTIEIFEPTNFGECDVQTLGYVMYDYPIYYKISPIGYMCGWCVGHVGSSCTGAVGHSGDPTITHIDPNTAEVDYYWPFPDSYYTHDSEGDHLHNYTVDFHFIYTCVRC